MIRRTQGVLTEDVEDGKDGTNWVVASTYPRDIQLPDNRHSNDNQVVSTFALLEQSTYHPASSTSAAGFPATDSPAAPTSSSPVRSSLCSHLRDIQMLCAIL
jgi:hypothetical protein